MRTLACKHKICKKKKPVQLRPDFTALNVFNVLETCKLYQLMTILEFVNF